MMSSVAAAPSWAASSWGAARRGFRAVHTSLHFQKGYNFTLFIICAGALMGFVLARFQYLAFDNHFLVKYANPTDAIYFRRGSTKPKMRYGIIIHLATILPAGFLVCFQFVPIIRHKFRLFHRINGYIVITLLLLSIAGSCLMFPTFMDYDAVAQVSVGVLAASSGVSVIIAYINIKRLQIDQHRAWMLRTWAYASSIISMRLVQIAARHAINNIYPDRFWRAYTCGKIFEVYRTYGVPDSQNPTPILYPNCAPSGPTSFDPTLRTVVPANTNPINVGGGQTIAATPERISAQASLIFGIAFWVAFVLHAIAVEFYLRLTPKENNRLKQVSYERQLARGMKNPGSAGLVAQRFGDAEKYVPMTEKAVREGVIRKESQTSDSDRTETS